MCRIPFGQTASPASSWLYLWSVVPPVQGGGPTEYLSTTRYEDCPVRVLLRFFLDSHFLAEWDKMVLSYCQLSLCHSSGVETGRFVKQYPFCSPREYLLTWQVWEGAEGDFYCYTKVGSYNKTVPILVITRDGSLAMEDADVATRHSCSFDAIPARCHLSVVGVHNTYLLWLTFSAIG